MLLKQCCATLYVAHVRYVELGLSNAFHNRHRQGQLFDG